LADGLGLIEGLLAVIAPTKLRRRAMIAGGC
jgi:hypothetical protein